jgi:hypothetical protein
VLDDGYNDDVLATNPDTGGGFGQVDNGNGTAGSVTESGSLARIVDGDGQNTNGILSNNAFDLSDSSLSYTTTWEVANWTTGTSDIRRIFLTLQTNDSWIFGGDTEESRVIVEIDAAGNNAFVRYQNRSGGSNTNFDSAAFDLGALDQDTDGFTATLEFDSTGFSFITSGLDATNQVNIADSWSNLGTDFATVVGTDGSMHVTGFIQDTGATGSQLDFDRISVTAIPEPSSIVLIGLSCGIGVFLRRRR